VAKIVITSIVWAFLVTAVSFASHPEIGWLWRIAVFAGLAIGMVSFQGYNYLHSNEPTDET
jgi:hypothetical protein